MVNGHYSTISEPFPAMNRNQPLMNKPFASISHYSDYSSTAPAAHPTLIPHSLPTFAMAWDPGGTWRLPGDPVVHLPGAVLGRSVDAAQGAAQMAGKGDLSGARGGGKVAMVAQG